MSSKFRKIMKFVPQFFTILGAVSVAFAMLLSMVNIPVHAEPNPPKCPETGLYVKVEAIKNQETYKSNTYGWVRITADNDQAFWGAYTPYEVINACIKAGAGGIYYVDDPNGTDKLSKYDISHVVVYFTEKTPTPETPTPETPTPETPTPETPTPETPTPETPTPETPTPEAPTPTPEQPTATPTDPGTTPTPDDPQETPTPGDPSPTPEDPTATPGTDETPDPTPQPTLPPPTSNDPPTILIPVTGMEIGNHSPIDKVQSVMFNMGLGFLGLGLVLQSLRKKMNF